MTKIEKAVKRLGCLWPLSLKEATILRRKMLQDLHPDRSGEDDGFIQASQDWAEVIQWIKDNCVNCELCQDTGRILKPGGFGGVKSRCPNKCPII